MKETVDLLAFGAHPDDVEIGASGILAKHVQAGYKVAICDLTKAELSSNGTVELRQQEAKKAGEILGISARLCLGFPDRGLRGTSEQILRIAQVIRQLKPKIVLAPYFRDRHPDHVACSQMVKEALFDAGIVNQVTPGGEPPHRVGHLYYYFINDVTEPDVIVDVSDVYERKMEALKAYASQFFRTQGTVETPLNQSNYFDMIRGRDAMWGHQIQARWGEALVSSRPIRLNQLL